LTEFAEQQGKQKPASNGQFVDKVAEAGGVELFAVTDNT